MVQLAGATSVPPMGSVSSSVCSTLADSVLERRNTPGGGAWKKLLRSGSIGTRGVTCGNGVHKLGRKGPARKVLVRWFQSGGGTYAVVDGRAWQPDGGWVQTVRQSDGARVEAVGRERK